MHNMEKKILKIFSPNNYQIKNKTHIFYYIKI